MKYLGSISGSGVLKHEGIVIAEAAYELEGYVHRVGGVTGSGEICLTPSALQAALEQPELQLLIGGNRLLNIKFSDKKVRAGNYVHVDVSGDLPDEEDWHH